MRLSWIKHWMRFSTLIMIIMLIIIFFISKRTPKHVSMSLPEPNTIKRVVATIPDLQPSFGISPVPDFTVPKKYVPLLLWILTPLYTAEDSSCNSWKLAQLKIATNGGKDANIEICWTGQNKLCVIMNGRCCCRGGEQIPFHLDETHSSYADEGILFVGLLREINIEGLTGTKSEVLHGKIIPLFEKIKGEKYEIGK